MNYENQIIIGNCIEIMKEIDDLSIDLILTDPPYNAKNIGPNQRVYSLGQMQLPEKEYKKFCKDWFKEAKRIAKTIVFTPGIANTHNYPQPFWQICWHKPAAVSFNRMGGYNAWEPIFIYGKPTERLGQDYKRQDTLNLTKGIEKKHPCPKPLPLIEWLVQKFSKENDLVLDPFNGSGTTTKAANFLNRRFIGIDINPEYVAIAKERLKQQAINFNAHPKINPKNKNN